MNEWPVVSIVTPSLNQSRFIRATIDSVLSQDYPNLEYWVIDGGSKDGTLEILQSYDGRLRWLSEPDSGQSQAVNKGWRLSRGGILGWVNADDLLQPLAVRHAVEALLENRSMGAVYGDAVYIDEMGDFIQPYPAREFDYEEFVVETENFIPQPGVFMRRAVLERAGFLNEALHYVMDHDLWLRMGLVAPMAYLPVPMAALRWHSAAKTAKAMSKFAREFEFIYQDFCSNQSLSVHIRTHRNIIMHKALVHSASFCFWGGETGMAIQYLRKAWRAHPFPRRRTFWLLLAFSLFGRAGFRLAEILHGNPMRFEKGIFTR
jgi:GT2 family glycosyltransferase